MKIYKYRLHQIGVNEINVPVATKFLSVGLDLEEVLCIWGAITQDTIFETVKVEVVFTGEGPTECKTFLGTVTANLIYHVFTE